MNIDAKLCRKKLEFYAAEAVKKPPEISSVHRSALEVIADKAFSGNRKSCLSVTITLLLAKDAAPEQDIRLHQAGMEGGFSARGLDANCTVPFLKDRGYPAPQESGWLTRSFENASPFDMQYGGRITPSQLKESFLFVVDALQRGDLSARAGLLYLLSACARHEANRSELEISRPKFRAIAELMDCLQQHWDEGNSKLPVLGVYAIYQNIIQEMERYRGCGLVPLASHTSADEKSGLVGDIQITRHDGSSFEGVEIKHSVPITSSIVGDCMRKIQRSNGLAAYYVLSTSNRLVSPNEQAAISDLVAQADREHQCQIIINGVIPTVKYYLRLIKDMDSFVHSYVRMLANDAEIPHHDKKRWNKIVGPYIKT